jgi:hypothetical protein
MVVEPVRTKIKSIIKNNEQQLYADCCRNYYTKEGIPKKRLPTDREVEISFEFFLGWIRNGIHFYHGSIYEKFFIKIAKSFYEQWKQLELDWPEFPIEVPSRIKILSGYWIGKDKTITIPFSSNDLNDVRGFITAGNIVYAGLKGNLGNHDMKCKTYVESNIDFYIECWKSLIYENTGVDWRDL